MIHVLIKHEELRISAVLYHFKSIVAGFHHHLSHVPSAPNETRRRKRDADLYGFLKIKVLTLSPVRPGLIIMSYFIDVVKIHLLGKLLSPVVHGADPLEGLTRRV